MGFKKFNNDFEVEYIQRGNLDEWRVKWWEYKIISKLSEKEVREFCENYLQPKIAEFNSENPFAPKVVEFKNVTNLCSIEFGDMYYYKVKKETTA